MATGNMLLVGHAPTLRNSENTARASVALGASEPNRRLAPARGHPAVHRQHNTGDPPGPLLVGEKEHSLRDVARTAVPSERVEGLERLDPSAGEVPVQERRKDDDGRDRV